MSGSEQAKAKENAAAIMRAKQLAGMLLPISVYFPVFIRVTAALRARTSVFCLWC
jgi:hypothetical protein